MRNQLLAFSIVSISTTRQFRILSVGFEAELLRLRNKVLELHGYAVVSALTTDEALKVVREVQDLVLVLLDQTVPSESRDSLTQQLEQLDPGLPLIVMYLPGTEACPQAHATVDSTDLDGLIDVIQKALESAGVIPRKQQQRIEIESVRKRETG